MGARNLRAGKLTMVSVMEDSMSFGALIDGRSAVEHLNDETWLFVDCRFSLKDPGQGFRDYQKAHIPGAVYAHLDDDLSSKVILGKTGRHPLPKKDVFVETCSRWGIGKDTQVVAYDASAGQMAAARLWWLLKWAGHEAVAVLDGGFGIWLASGLPYSSSHCQGVPQQFPASFNDDLVWTATDVSSVLSDSRYILLDSRTVDRYRGENETIDPVAGHIPGALSAPYIENIDDQGLLRGEAELRERFNRLTLGAPADRVVVYCGSGVTASQNALALVHSGIGMPRLYAGSWSDWIVASERPVVKSESSPMPIS